MDSWVPIIVAIVTGLTGVPVLNFVGQRYLGRVSAAEKLREAELADRLAWQKQQQRDMTDLRTRNRTMEEALRDTERRCDELERKQVAMAEQLARQTSELETLRASDAQKSTEIIQHQNRIRSLEAELYRTQQELQVERRAREELERKSS